MRQLQLGQFTAEGLPAFQGQAGAENAAMKHAGSKSILRVLCQPSGFGEPSGFGDLGGERF